MVCTLRHVVGRFPEHIFRVLIKNSCRLEHHHQAKTADQGILGGEYGIGQSETVMMQHIHNNPHQNHRHNILAEAEADVREKKKRNNAKIKIHHMELGHLGVLLHVLGDALNNLGVIIAALVIWLTKYHGRFYADPGVGLAIAIMILVTALPLVFHSGTILLQTAPKGVKVEDVKHDIEKIDGIESIHELHIWSLDQKKAIASVHVVVEKGDIASFLEQAKTINECFHAYGIHSTTLQPEVSLQSQSLLSDQEGICSDSDVAATRVMSSGSTELVIPSEALEVSTLCREPWTTRCQIICSTKCESLACCASKFDRSQHFSFRNKIS